MIKHNWLKYSVLTATWLILLAVVYFNIRSSENNGFFSTDRHLGVALTSLLGKTLFVFGIIFYLLPQLSKKRKISIFIMEVIAWLIVCYMTEQYMLALLKKTGAQIHTSTPSFNHSFSWFSMFLYLLLLLILFAWHFTREWIRNERNKRVLIESQFTTELNFLKNQLNPHFLFNTLNNLFSIAHRNHDIETAGGISKLAGLMRYMLYESSVTKISLEKELQHIHNFIELSKLRYSKDEVVTEVKTDGDITQAILPPMLLLPFVENAFKHGIDVEKESKIRITLKVVGSTIHFACINTVMANHFVKYDDYGGIGLENVKRRLALLYPGKHQLDITDTGSTFTVLLQLENE